MRPLVSDTDGVAEDKTKSGGHWKIIAGVAVGALIAGIVIYSFQSGLMVRKLSVPGMVELEFADRQGLGSVAEPEKANESALRENQSRLESKLSELEERLADRDTSGDASEPDATAPIGNSPSEHPGSSVPSLDGQWSSPQGLTYVVQQRGDYLAFQEFNPLLGITAVGEGTVHGRQVDIAYSTAMGTFGQASLRVSDDGRMMWGQARDVTTGAVTNMQLQR